MSSTHFIRRAASRVIHFATRTTGTQRCYHHQTCSTLFSTAAKTTRGTALSRNIFRSPVSASIHRFSTKSEENLVRVIDSEIQCALETDEEHDKVEDVPENFPFEIVDEPGLQTLTLTRNFQGESITVEVHMPNLITGEEDENDDDDSESANQSQLPLVVKISKKNGPCLEFGVTAFPDEISIDSLSIKDPKAGEDEIAYEGPDFGDLDENLQKAFHKYLDIRGINPRATNFLHEYMVNKDSREYVEWLKNVKKFVEA